MTNKLVRLALAGAATVLLTAGCATMRENRQIDEALKRYEAKQVFAESSWQEGVVDTGEGYEIIVKVKNLSERNLTDAHAQSTARNKLSEYLQGNLGEVKIRGSRVTGRMFENGYTSVIMYVPYSGVQEVNK